MALIPPFFLDCVVAIGDPAPGLGTRWIATGFLYGEHVVDEPTKNTENSGSDGPSDDSQTEKHYRIALVTNRHVFDGLDRIIVRLNPVGTEPAEEFPLTLRQSGGELSWHGHSNPDVDIAVCPIRVDLLAERGFQVRFFRSDDHAITLQRAEQLGVTEGDGVFTLGFPLGLVTQQRNFVIVRQGCIARIRDAVTTKHGNFLIDTSVFPGNSGGPVVTRPEMTTIKGTKGSNAAYVIGVVSSYLPYQDVAISAQTKRPRIIFEENSGLAVVVPIDRVHEAIEEHDSMLGPQSAESSA